MATVAGFVLGNLILPGVGGMIGASIGSMIDSMLIQEIFGETQTGPRLDETRIQTGQEGTPERVIYGSNNRVAGTVIWVSDLIEVKHEEEVGGIGGIGGQEVEWYEYFIHLAVHLCKNSTTDIVKVWANGKVLHDEDNDINLTGKTCNLQRVPFLGGYLAKITEPAGTIDFKQFKAGKTVTLSGWDNANNNGTFFVLSRSSTRLTVHNDNCVNATNDSGVGFFQEVPDTKRGAWEDMTEYVGAQTSPDPLMVEWLGSGNVPVYHGTYCVIERLALKDFGNGVPNLEFGVKNTTVQNLTAVIEDIMTRAGYPASRVDTTGVTGSTSGYVTNDTTPALKQLSPLLTVYNILMQERNGVFYFFDRDNAETIALDLTEAAARPIGGSADEPLRLKDPTDLSLPTEINVRYVDSDKDLQSGSQRARLTVREYDKAESVTLPVTMTGDEAKGMAKRLLWQRWAARQTVEISLPPDHINLCENDLVTFTAFGKSWLALVQQIDRGADDFLIRVEAIEEQSHIWDLVGDVDDPYYGNATIPFTPPLSMVISDVAPFSDEHAQIPGFYYGASAMDTEPPFIGGTLFESTDDTTFNPVHYIDAEATIGYALTTLPSGRCWVWDMVSTVDVQMLGGATLSSTDEDGVYAGLNWLAIGDEVIAFLTATSLGENQYRLSGLLRGLRGTEANVGGHATSEGCMLLIKAGLRFRQIAYGDVGAQRYYKAVSRYHDEDDYESVSHVLAGGSVKPFTVVHIKGTWDASDNLTVVWTRRSRAMTKLVIDGIAPIMENPVIGTGPDPGGVSHQPGTAFEEYEVEFWNSAGTTLLRGPVTVQDQTQIVYTATQQNNDDSGSAGDPKLVKIYQIGQAGRGDEATKSIAGS